MSTIEQGRIRSGLSMSWYWCNAHNRAEFITDLTANETPSCVIGPFNTEAEAKAAKEATR